jgi:hypothetical protein
MEHMIVKRILDIGLFHNQIEGALKVRKKSNRLIGCCHSRKTIIIVLQQLKNFERWTAKVKYGSIHININSGSPIKYLAMSNLKRFVL